MPSLQSLRLLWKCVSSRKPAVFCKWQCSHAHFTYRETSRCTAALEGQEHRQATATLPVLQGPLSWDPSSAMTMSVSSSIVSCCIAASLGENAIGDLMLIGGPEELSWGIAWGHSTLLAQGAFSLPRMLLDYTVRVLNFNSNINSSININSNIRKYVNTLDSDTQMILVPCLLHWWVIWNVKLGIIFWHFA